MREPQPIAGARVPLFDRLDLDPEIDDSERPFRILTREQLKASVRRELERLLNTRCSLSLDQIGEEERSVINYGIPDFSSLSAQNADDQMLIGRIIGQTVSAFEPRLTQVAVDVRPVPHSEARLYVFIDAWLTVGQFNEPVYFPVVLNNKNGAAEFHDSE
ncbi:MAG TPA: type VI secretion system baseplate subunit TssE [Pyrinomonadaceae bacterium]|nr:type VI secretion system baseplate subunit TssE [Pyrinomonadaceae bacterium]